MGAAGGAPSIDCRPTTAPICSRRRGPVISLWDATRREDQEFNGCLRSVLGGRSGESHRSERCRVVRCVLVPSVAAYLSIGGLAAVVTFGVTPIVGRIARRFGWVYLPNERTVHTEPLPDVGGLAMFIGFIVALRTAWAFDVFDPLFAANSEPLGVLIAAIIIFGTGFIDDVRELSAPAKVFGTVLAGVALVYFGVVMDSFRLPYLGETILSDDLKPLVTVLWLVGMSQAINLIDGLDGLAAGVVAIGAFAFFLYSQELTARRPAPTEQHRAAVRDHRGRRLRRVPAAQLQPGADHDGRRGSVAARAVARRVDERGRWARRFVRVGVRSVTTYFFLAPIAIPLLILGVPIVDTVFAIIRRATSRRRSPPPTRGICITD